MMLNEQIYTTFRLEPQNVGYSIEENMSAPLKDPLWMLGRQWQMGEFTAEDGGIPVGATVQYREVEPENIAFSNGIEADIPSNVPFEKTVEENPASWNSENLRYEFSVEAPSFKLASKDYFGDELDWYHFDLESFQTSGNLEKKVSALVPISYPGMPHPRWWRYENGDINFRKLSHPQINNLTMLITEFGFIYGQDWYQISLNYLLGSLRQLESLTIVDSFGIKTDVQVVRDNSQNDSGFEMFCLERSASPIPINANQLFYLPNNAWHTQQGEDLENVSWLRDEVSNAIWAIENLYTDGNNKQVNRNDLEDVQFNQITESEKVHEMPVYRQEILPPKHWVPYIQPLNRKAGKLRRARTYLEPEKQYEGNILEKSVYIHQNQVSRLGIQISVNKQLARTLSDKLVVWESKSRQISPYTPQNPIAFDEILKNK